MGLLAMLAGKAHPTVPLKICCVQPCRSSTLRLQFSKPLHSVLRSPAM
jgi:hypothetical protein